MSSQPASKGVTAILGSDEFDYYHCGICGTKQVHRDGYKIYTLIDHADGNSIRLLICRKCEEDQKVLSIIKEVSPEKIEIYSGKYKDHKYDVHSYSTLGKY